MGTKIQVTVDCADVPTVLAFWAAALGHRQEPPPGGYEGWDAFAADRGIPRAQWRGALVDPAGVGPRLFFQTVPEPKVTKNRWHLDLEVTVPGSAPDGRRAAIAAKVAELVALGATEVGTIDEGDGAFTVLRDRRGQRVLRAVTPVRPPAGTGGRSVSGRRRRRPCRGAPSSAR